MPALVAACKAKAGKAVPPGRLWTQPPSSGRHFACRRGRHLAARIDEPSHADDHSAGQDARLWSLDILRGAQPWAE
jgi:hypothetical protein